MDPNKKMGFGVGIMVLRDGKVLLGKRNNDPAKAGSALHGEGTWTMPGGKVHFGESLEDAAFREVMEETGMKINKQNLRLISLTNDIVTEAHFATIGFLCRDFSGEPEVMEPDEITKWGWFALDNLPEPLFPPCRKIIRNYFDGKIY